LEPVFFSIGLIIIVAGIGAYLARTLKQPLIPAYIIVGIILGPVLKIITDLNKLLKIKINHMKALEERHKRHPHHSND